VESKEELKELLTKIKDDENIVEKYSDTFANFFETLKTPNTNVLECMFENFISLAYRPTKTNRFLTSQLAKIDKKLRQAFTTEEQERLFDIYDYVQTQYSNDYCLKAFVYAYCLGDTTRVEQENFKMSCRALRDQIHNGISNTNNISSPNLFDVIKLVRNKYKSNTHLILADDDLTIEYLIYRNGEQDVYKTLKVEEFEDKLKVTIYSSKIVMIVDIKELADILLVLEKQSQAKEFSKQEIQFIKEKYKPGQKIQLIKMYDFQAPPTNTIGIIYNVDDKGQVHVNWESGSSLALNVAIDEFNVIE